MKTIVNLEDVVDKSFFIGSEVPVQRTDLRVCFANPEENQLEGKLLRWQIFLC